MMDIKVHISAFILMFSIILCKSLHAQQITVRGVISEKGTPVRIALALVTDTNNHITVGSNDMGFFQIKAKIGDTLWFFKRHFTDQYVVVKDDKEIIIHLVRADMMLEDVTIKPENKQQNLSAVKLEHRKKTYFYGHKRNPFYYLRSPITAILELFGQERKNAKRFDRYVDQEEKELEVDRFFNLSLVRSNTTLNGKALEKFMIDYRPTHEKIKEWNMYDAASYIKKSAVFYLDTLKR